MLAVIPLAYIALAVSLMFVGRYLIFETSDPGSTSPLHGSY